MIYTPAVVLVLALGATITDMRCGRIPNALNYGALILLCLCAVAENRIVGALLGMVSAGGSLALLHYGTGGRGLGLGDVKMAAAIGTALGVQGGFQALAVAFIAGAVGGLFGLQMGWLRRGQRVPFAPYLALGVGMTLLFPCALGAFL